MFPNDFNGLEMNNYYSEKILMIILLKFNDFAIIYAQQMRRLIAQSNSRCVMERLS
jgi:hypothetical protein